MSEKNSIEKEINLSNFSISAFHGNKNRSYVQNEPSHFYEVESIKSKKINNSGKIFYLVKWNEFSEDEMSWEPLENLISVMGLIEDYERREINNIIMSQPDCLRSTISYILDDDEANFNIDNRNHKNEDKFRKIMTRRMNSKNLSETPQTNKNDFMNNIRDNYLSRKNENFLKKKTIGKNNLAKIKNTSKNSFDKINKNFINLVSVNSINNENLNIPLQENYLKVNLKFDFCSKIKMAKLINGKLFFWVEWLSRSDGTTPEDCLVAHHIIKNLYPMVLIDFYESRLKFGTENFSVKNELNSTREEINNKLIEENNDNNVEINEKNEFFHNANSYKNNFINLNREDNNNSDEEKRMAIDNFFSKPQGNNFSNHKTDESVAININTTNEI